MDVVQLLEDGLDGSYHEVWERVPESRGLTAAFRLQGAQDPSRAGVLAVAGNCFHFAGSRAVQLPASGRKLLDILQGLPLDQQKAILAFEVSFGHIKGGQQPWGIISSTLPGRAGEPLLPAGTDLSAMERLAANRDIIHMGKFQPDGGWKVVSACS